MEYPMTSGGCTFCRGNAVGVRLTAGWVGDGLGLAVAILGSGVFVTCRGTAVGSNAIRRGRLSCVGVDDVTWGERNRGRNCKRIQATIIIIPPVMIPIANKPMYLFFKVENSGMLSAL
jgi:hypothetical protein